jgi:hypothetical protein
MGTEQLYFIIGFLLGTLIVGSVSVLVFVLWSEWVHKKQDNQDTP